MVIRCLATVLLLLGCVIGCVHPGLMAQQSAANPTPVHAVVPGEEYSGMYTFLTDGEFVQVSVGDQGKVTGFVSRYGDAESDRGEFLDHFFKDAKLDGEQLSFSTQTVHGVWFAFKGRVNRGPAKDSAEEGYYVLRGVVTVYQKDAVGKESARERDVVFKRFPDDVTGNSSQSHK